MSNPDTLCVTLNPGGVAQPARQAAFLARHAVGFSLRAFENEEALAHLKPAVFAGYGFDCEWGSEEQRRELCKNWLLCKGFQDLARGVRETLEEAAFYIGVVKLGSGVATRAQLEAMMAEIRAGAAKLQFPKLLADVNAGLVEPVAFQAEFSSLQKVRNCLEHRGGIAGPRDVDQATGAMTPNLPYVRVYYLHEGREVEVLLGEVIDTHAPDNPFGEGREVGFHFHLATRSRSFALGEPVTISARGFCETAMACVLFADDVAAKLPKPPASAPPAQDSGLSGGIE